MPTRLGHLPVLFWGVEEPVKAGAPTLRPPTPTSRLHLQSSSRGSRPVVIIPNLQTRKLRQDSSAHGSQGRGSAALLHPEMTMLLPPQLPTICPCLPLHIPLPGPGFSLQTARLQPEGQAMQRSWRNNPLSVRVRPARSATFCAMAEPVEHGFLGRLCLLCSWPGESKTCQAGLAKIMSCSQASS